MAGGGACVAGGGCMAGGACMAGGVCGRGIHVWWGGGGQVIKRVRSEIISSISSISSMTCSKKHANFYHPQQ